MRKRTITVIVVQAMSPKNYKEVHGNKRHVANAAGMEQRSKYQNELTKKKRIGDYPRGTIGDRELVGVLSHRRWGHHQMGLGLFPL